MAQCSVATKWYLPFCAEKRRDPYMGSHPTWSDRELRSANTLVLSIFVVWLFPQLNQGSGGRPETALAYVSRIVGWHQRTFLTPLPYDYREVSKVVDGLKEDELQAHGVITPVQIPAITAEQLNAWLRLPSTVYDWQSDTGTVWRALLLLAIMGINRAEDVSWNSKLPRVRNPLRSAVRWYSTDDVVVVDVTTVPDRELSHCEVTTPPGKADKYGVLAALHPTTLFLRGGGFQAAEALLRMERTQPCQAPHRASTPLFRLPGDTEGIPYVSIGRFLRHMDQITGMSRDIALTPKTLRITGASLARRAGHQIDQIKERGRWASDIAFIYLRESLQEKRYFARKIAMVLHRESIPRQRTSQRGTAPNLQVRRSLRKRRIST